MRLISSLSLSDHLYDKIQAAARAGFDGIEIFREDMLGFNGTAAEVAELARNEGIAIATLQSLRDVEGLTGDARVRAFRRAARFMDFATELGAPTLIVSANCATDTDPDPGRAAADLAELADLAASRGLRLGFEPLAISRHTRTPLQGWELVKAADRPNLGLVIGSIHHFASGEGNAALQRIDPARIHLVRLADAMVRRIDVDMLRQANRILPGQGVLPLSEFMRDLKAAGYAGPFSIEVFDAAERGLPPAMQANDAMRALMLIEAQAEGRGVDARLVGPPSFLHLRAADPSAATAASVLSAFGFVETGRSGDSQHRFFTQGSLSVVLSPPDDGSGRLQVTGVGLISPDPEGLRRAADPQGCHSQPAGSANWDNPFGLTRLNGPSIHLYFDQQPLTRSCFVADLIPTGAVPTVPAQVTYIDHIGQAFHRRGLLSGLLYYRAALGFTLIERRDVLDPHGAVHSYALRSGKDGFALTLNAAEGDSTMTGRFLGKGGATPVHHVAFGCDGLLALGARIDPALVLRPPANYYTDLMLRFDLAPDMIEQLEAGSFFYDEEPGGSYLQLYTRVIDGVFFELVERRGSYTGFGAANAAARIRAQSEDYESRGTNLDNS